MGLLINLDAKILYAGAKLQLAIKVAIVSTAILPRVEMMLKLA